MSRLYIRVMTGFYTHRKTVKLRSKIGQDANWIPPRLWAYAAENQPDGDLAGYSSEEISELIGCPKYATSILQALKDCRFVDESGMIHDWNEHNGYHQKFSERAKKAAAARWGSPVPPPETGKGKGERGDKHCLTNACSILPTEGEATAMTMNAGIPSDFCKYVYQDWSTRSGKDAGGILVQFLPYVTKRWTREQNEWKSKTHKGNHGNSNSRNGEKRIDRSIGTANEGVASQYANFGKVAKPANPQ